MPVQSNGNDSSEDGEQLISVFDEDSDASMTTTTTDSIEDSLWRDTAASNVSSSSGTENATTSINHDSSPTNNQAATTSAPFLNSKITDATPNVKEVTTASPTTVTTTASPISTTMTASETNAPGMFHIKNDNQGVATADSIRVSAAPVPTSAPPPRPTMDDGCLDACVPFMTETGDAIGIVCLKKSIPHRMRISYNLMGGWEL